MAKRLWNVSVEVTLVVLAEDETEAKKIANKHARDELRDTGPSFPSFRFAGLTGKGLPGRWITADTAYGDDMAIAERRKLIEAEDEQGGEKA